MTVTKIKLITPPAVGIQTSRSTHKDTSMYMDYETLNLDKKQTFAFTNLYSTSNIYQPRCSTFADNPRIIQWSPSKGAEGETLSIILEQPLPSMIHSTATPVDNPPMKVLFGNIFLDTIQQQHIIPPADPRQDSTQMLWTTLIARIPYIPESQNFEQNKVPIIICTFADEMMTLETNHWPVGDFVLLRKTKEFIRKRSFETTDEPKSPCHKRYDSSTQDAMIRAFDLNDLEIILLLAPAIVANEKPAELHSTQIASQHNLLTSSLTDTPYSQIAFKESDLTLYSQPSSTFSYSSSSSSTPNDPGTFLDQSPKNPSISSEYNISTAISNSFSTPQPKDTCHSPFSETNYSYSNVFNLLKSADVDSNSPKNIYSLTSNIHLNTYTSTYTDTDTHTNTDTNTNTNTNTYNDHENTHSQKTSADRLKQFRQLQSTQTSDSFSSSTCAQTRIDQISNSSNDETNMNRMSHCSYPSLERIASSVDAHKLCAMLTKPFVNKSINNDTDNANNNSSLVNSDSRVIKKELSMVTLPTNQDFDAQQKNQTQMHHHHHQHQQNQQHKTHDVHHSLLHQQPAVTHKGRSTHILATQQTQMSKQQNRPQPKPKISRNSQICQYLKRPMLQTMHQQPLPHNNASQQDLDFQSQQTGSNYVAHSARNPYFSCTQSPDLSFSNSLFPRSYFQSCSNESIHTNLLFEDQSIKKLMEIPEYPTHQHNSLCTSGIYALQNPFAQNPRLIQYPRASMNSSIAPTAFDSQTSSQRVSSQCSQTELPQGESLSFVREPHHRRLHDSHQVQSLQQNQRQFKNSPTIATNDRVNRQQQDKISMYYPFINVLCKADLDFTPDFMDMTRDWTVEEIQNSRRIVRFWRALNIETNPDGTVGHAQCFFEPVSVQDYKDIQASNASAAAVATAMGNNTLPKASTSTTTTTTTTTTRIKAMTTDITNNLLAGQLDISPSRLTDVRLRNLVVSCIYSAEINDFIITSVDCIHLMEGLVGVEFTVEEKNRIRRNLEGLRPITVGKGRPEYAAFFRLIMNFPEPRPRNIEKDLKVFLWSDLEEALRKIIKKYTPSYSSAAIIYSDSI